MNSCHTDKQQRSGDRSTGWSSTYLKNRRPFPIVCSCCLRCSLFASFLPPFLSHSKLGCSLLSHCTVIFFSSSKPQQHNCKITQFHHASFAFCHPSLLNPVLISWNLSSFFNFYIHFSPFSHRDGCTTQQAKWNPQCLLGSRTKHLPYCLGSGGRKRCKTPCRVTIQILSLLRA